MTPSERERRINAAVSAMVCPSWRRDPARRAELAAALNAADEAVPVVPATWDGLLEHLDATYPADVFSGESGDVGARLVVLTRRLAGAEAAARDLSRAAKDVQKAWRASSLTDRMFDPMGQLAEALARHPSFSGEEGTGS